MSVLEDQPAADPADDDEYEMIEWRPLGGGKPQFVRGARKKPPEPSDEEQSSATTADECLVSIAISLQRIADALEASTRGVAMKKAL